MLPASLDDDSGVRQLVSGPRTRRELALILGDMSAGSSIHSIDLTRSTYKPGRTLRALYDVEVGSLRWPVAVTWRGRSVSVDPGPRRAGPEPAAEHEHAALRSVDNEPFQALAAHSQALGASVNIWPFDPELSGLAATVEHWRRIDGTVDVVRYRPGQRHVLRIGRRGAATLYVKLATQTGEATLDKATINALLDAVELSGGEASRAALVGPVDVSMPSLGAIAYPEVTGHSPWQYLDASQLKAALETLAQLAATLHRTEGAAELPVPHRLVSEELALVERASEHIVALAPELSSAVGEVLAVATDALGHDSLHCLIHGDLKLDHVFASGRGIKLIDLDGMRLADPATDIAKLLAELRFLAVDSGRRELLTAADAFTARYRLHGSNEAVDRAERLEPALLVKMAARRISLADQRWRRRVAEIVHAASRLSRGTEAGVAP